MYAKQPLIAVMSCLTQISNKISKALHKHTPPCYQQLKTLFDNWFNLTKYCLSQQYRL